jgi:DNA primase
MEIETVARAVASAGGRVDTAPAPAQRRAPDASSPRGLIEREALKLALQEPVLAGPVFDSLDETVYAHPVHAAVRSAIGEAGGASSGTSGAVWVEKVRDACDDLAAKAAVGELAVEPLRLDGEPDPRYVGEILARLQLHAVDQRIRELKSRLQRINPVTNQDEHLQLFGELVSLEQHARALREQASGSW